MATRIAAEFESSAKFHDTLLLQYRNFILKLSQSMSKQDVSLLCYIYQLDAVPHPPALEALFALERRGIFSQRNFTPLVDVFKYMNRYDLAEKCATFCNYATAGLTDLSGVFVYVDSLVIVGYIGHTSNSAR